MGDKLVLDELQWRNPEWIQMFGINTDNVLDYFSQSPFYDRTSNNQVLKMQAQFSENFYNRNLLSELKKMTGTEFIVAHVKEPDFWIIRKQNRLSINETVPIADYFIIGVNIYMAPTIHSIVQSRLLNTCLALRNSLDSIRNLAYFSPSQGHGYIVDPNMDSINESNNATNATNNNASQTSTIPINDSSVNLSQTQKSNTESQSAIDESVIQAQPSVIFDQLIKVTYKNQKPY
ncbi:mediator complex subunit MED6 [Ascoidea rubescens DSM 1968]|uniref:Mediator of RNA polymerase II transcription subunit 6 n=1 Tax=Ascoidea rubescens DSM 1968 TaxID=1344418 RepID=A0A1D2VL48_9ASCO|nr:MED6-domain-containing protein [Ascoidea rubescens DSM 1968]ODV62329.1 MED6-domain-containing protein [Ascoidea rubescens DSM 1968]